MHNVRRLRLPRAASIAAVAGTWLAFAGLLGGCMMDKAIDLPGRDQVTDPIRDADLRARWTGPVGGTSGATAAVRTQQPMVFPGADQDLAPSPTQQDARDVTAGTATRMASAVDGDVIAEGGGIELNFDNADIPTVVKSVIGDSLGMNYVVDPRVQGVITLASAQRIPRKDVLPIFESVLRMSNAALLREDNLVRIVPLPEAAGAGVSVIGAGQPGYGVSIVPLRFVSAAAIGKTAESFLSRPGAVRVDQARNVLLIQGTASERQAALGVIGTLDVEWLRNQSVGLYPLKSTAPDTMIRELEKVFDTADGGQGQGVIKFQPVSRMNAVLAVSKNSKVLERATQWVRRLDRSDPTGTTVRVYSLRFGNARSIARTLNEMFVGRSSQSAGDSQTSATAPGQNGTTSRIDSLGAGTLGSSNNNNNTQGATGGSTDVSGNANKTQVGFGDRKDDDQDNAGPAGGTALGSLPRGVFQNVRISADKSTNAIMVYSNQEDYLVIERALEQLDRPRLQVAVDAMVAEVTLTNQLQYGVQAYLTSANAGAGPDKGSVGLFTAAQSAAQTALLSRVLPGFNAVLGAEANPKLVLNALSTLTTVKVLSAPSLVVADNEPAILEVGDQVPISTGSTVTGLNVVSSISRQNTGIILKVLPHVHPNGSIELEIEQEVSNVVNPAGASAQNLTPTISQRRIHSTIATSSGQTALLGGLIKEDDERTVSGLPGLNEIKYLGDLLGQKSDSKTRSEIIVFVTTKIVRNPHDAQVVAEEFRERLDSMRRAPTTFDAQAAPPAVARK
ncbi:type II secretion system secretin GspD [Bradyrhizobium sp. Ce-3]|uniref:type II secretion system secretin GspD n=1 Tax=Bradyrhizobium sp. Ce-3 TaxID=2913970 RepID=UPI001FC7D7FB|nr:type II secretion system secretin GspD [Bradyrhizobium sp. Ce-3]GKQ52149.1 type II secretion system protein GspD [Bradyrhizobium sp. Ce-3]